MDNKPCASRDEKDLTPDGLEKFATGRGTSKSSFHLLGDFHDLYCGYATDSSARHRVASGGVVTSLLRHALRTRMVDGVALSRADFSKGCIGYQFAIIEDPDEIQQFGTSAYFNIPVEKHWRELADYNGAVALCALPCHIRQLRGRREHGRGLANVKLFISLFCGHNNERELIDFVLRQHRIDVSNVVSLYVDRMYLGGHVWVTLRNQERRSIPFRHFNVYRALWFFSKQMCRYCDDHLGALSDVSVGDVFVPEYRRRDVKHSAIIVRTLDGRALVEDAMSHNILCAHRITPDVVFRAQKRIIVPSGDLLSRYYACRMAAYPAKRPVQGRFRLRTFLTYTLLHMNDRLSRTSWGRALIKWIPRPLLYGYIAAIKLINTSIRVR